MTAVLIRIFAEETQNNNSVIPLQNEMIIGRSLECNFRIPWINISRKHAKINFDGKNWKITDLKSTNGLFINRAQVIPDSPHCLKNEQIISFGKKINSEYVYKFVNNYIKEINQSSKNYNGSKSIIKQNEKLNICENMIKMDLEKDLSCAVCDEIFVHPVSLNCSHTFCYTCIEQWNYQKRQKLCPLCRIEIINQNPVLNLENFIENTVNSLSQNNRVERENLVKEREKIIYTYQLQKTSRHFIYKICS